MYVNYIKLLRKCNLAGRNNLDPDTDSSNYLNKCITLRYMLKFIYKYINKVQFM